MCIFYVNGLSKNNTNIIAKKLTQMGFCYDLHRLCRGIKNNDAGYVYSI